MELAEAQEIESRYLFDLYRTFRIPLVIERGEGAYVWDATGRRYLDLVSGGRAVTALGHCHPKVTAAIREQAGRLVHMSNDFYTAPMLELSRLLGTLGVCSRVWLCNSGAEANEAAIKLARKHAKAQSQDKVEIVAALDSFHGRTLATVAATGQPKYRQGFEPLPGGFVHVPYNDLDAMRGAVSERTCAVMLEPVLGEAGVFPAEKPYLAGVRRICDEAGAVLILDEVQTGLGRTGKMFAYEHYDIEPDIVTLAKALGGGMPIGAMLAREQAASAFKPGDHMSTYSGSALPAAAALAAMRAIVDEGLVENARRVGDHLANRLRTISCERVAEVRSLGMMIGVTLSTPRAAEVKQQCLEAGVLIITVGDRILRLAQAMPRRAQQKMSFDVARIRGDNLLVQQRGLAQFAGVVVRLGLGERFIHGWHGVILAREFFRSAILAQTARPQY
jgi:predicted acetylornithine/succinylornithine family transaminase